MKKEIKLPRISEGEDSGFVSDVYVKKGDHVEKEQSVLAVESDKATVDVPVDVEGIVEEVMVQKGDEISVGDTMIVLETNGAEENEEKEEEEKKQGMDKESEEKQEKARKGDTEEEGQKKKVAEQKKKEDEAKEAADEDTEEKASAEKEKKAEKESEKGERREEEDEHGAEEKEKRKNKEEEGIGAAPLARKFARELGIDLSELQGGDPERRVTREDVFGYARKRMKSKDDMEGSSMHRENAPALPDFSKWGETERSPMGRVRRITAEKTTMSWKNIPHVTQFDKADITDLDDFLRSKNKDLEEKVTITSVLIKVCGEALQLFPKFNASLDVQQKEIVFKKYVHLGVAVDTDGGLLLPVIRDVEQKSINQISSELTQLSNEAREGSLAPDKMQGGNFVVSNQGGIGGTAFTPLIFPPQVAILGVSRAEIAPVYDGEQFSPRMILPLCVSYDHRLIDGADAARFLRWICESLEEPMNLLMG